MIHLRGIPFLEWSMQQVNVPSIGREHAEIGRLSHTHRVSERDLHSRNVVCHASDALIPTVQYRDNMRSCRSLWKSKWIS